MIKNLILHKTVDKIYVQKTDKKNLKRPVNFDM